MNSLGMHYCYYHIVKKKMSKKEKMEKEIKKTFRERYRRTNANAEKNYVIIVDGKK